MEHRNLGRTGLQVSRLSFGAMTLGSSEGFMKGVTSTDDEGLRVLDRALDAGIDTIDTANIYSEGRSEELLGRWVKGNGNAWCSPEVEVPDRGNNGLGDRTAGTLAQGDPGRLARILGGPSAPNN